MKEHPIIVSTMMVQAMLQGRKNNTRRVVKPMRKQKEWLSEDVLSWSPSAYTCMIDNEQWAQFRHPHAGQTIKYPGIDEPLAVDSDSPLTCIKCPYGKPGDILWVRESWRWLEGPLGSGVYAFKADMPELKNRWETPIFMPKEAARIWLKVENVKVERLHDISPTDAFNEGVECWNEDFKSEPGAVHADYKNYLWVDDASHPEYNFPSLPNSVDSFKSLWISINGAKSWDANPWLWAVKFEILSTNGKPSLREVLQ